MNVYGKRGPVVRCVYLAAAMTWWLLTGFGRLGRARVVTLCYHGVTRDQRDRFRRQMALIAGRAVSAAAIGATRARPWALPRVCVTFDDAFANLLDHALPVTRELEIPVTVFAVTESPGSTPGWTMRPGHPERLEPTMSARQIVRAAGDPWCRFGSHGATHRRLPDLAPPEAQGELNGSKAALEAILDRRVDDFAFPHGACNRRLIDDAFEAGYRRLFTLDPSAGIDHGRGSVLGRMPVSPDVWLIEFALTAAGAYDWLPAVRRFVRRFGCGLRRPPETRRPMKILAVASSGGHWVQLLRLRPAFADEHVTYVTVNKAHAAEVGSAPFYVVNDATRWSTWSVLKLALRMAWITFRQRPDVVVTTGAAPGYFGVLFGKLLGARTVWIDSMANVDRLSLCGSKSNRWADLWLTQWPQLAREEGPHFRGAVM